MPKQYKIKRNRLHAGRQVYKAKPHPISVIFTVVVLVGLFFVGMSVYQPVYDWIMGNTSRSRDPVVPDLPESSADPADITPVEPSKPQPVVADDLRAVRLPHATATDPALLDSFLTALDSDVNALVVDLKDNQGNVLFASATPQVAQWGNGAASVVDLEALATKLEGKNLKLVGRMYAFEDRVACEADREYAILYQDTDWMWFDESRENGGKPWINPYSAKARQYIGALASEAADAGVCHIMLESVQFPKYSDGGYATFGEVAATVTRSQVLGDFIQELQTQLADKGTGLSVVIPASQFESDTSNVFYGGNPGAIAGDAIVIGLLPGQVTSDLTAGFTEGGKPLEESAVAYAKAQVASVRTASAADISVIPMVSGKPPAGVGAYIVYDTQAPDTLEQSSS